MAESFCLHCGHNIDHDAMVIDHDWQLAPNTALYRARNLPLTVAECSFLHTLASAKGRPIRADVIGSRIGSSEDPDNLARVIAWRIRHKLLPMLGSVPFETVFRAGYRWAA